MMLALALGFALTPPAQGPADRALDAAVSAYARVRTARAQFEQSIDNPLTGSTLTSRGVFEQQRPDKFVFRFDDPKGDLIVSDGRYVWLYLPSSAPGQVIRAPLKRGPAGSLDLIGEFFTNPRTRYVVGDAGADTVGGHVTRVVTLTPRNSDAAFVHAKVWIDPSGTLRQFEAEEPSGITRRVRITSFAPNVPVTAGAFTFRPPKGVRVVDGSAPGQG